MEFHFVLRNDCCYFLEINNWHWYCIALVDFSVTNIWTIEKIDLSIQFSQQILILLSKCVNLSYLTFLQSKFSLMKLISDENKNNKKKKRKSLLKFQQFKFPISNNWVKRNLSIKISNRANVITDHLRNSTFSIWLIKFT